MVERRVGPPVRLDRDRRMEVTRHKTSLAETTDRLVAQDLLDLLRRNLPIHPEATWRFRVALLKQLFLQVWRWSRSLDRTSESAVLPFLHTCRVAHQRCSWGTGSRPDR